MKEVLLKIIEKIQRDKASRQLYPCHVLLVNDILFPLRVEAIKALKELEKEGKVKCCQTINDEAYFIDESNQ